MTWRDLKIKKKIGIGFGLVVLLSTITCLVLLINLLKVDREITSLSDTYIPSVNESSRMDHFWESSNGYQLAQDYSGNTYYREMASWDIKSFQQALNNLITLSDSTQIKGNKKGIDLHAVGDLFESFDNIRNDYLNKEEQSTTAQVHLKEAFEDLNQLAESNTGSYNTQRTIAQLNKEYANLVQSVSHKNGVEIKKIANTLEELQTKLPQSPIKTDAISFIDQTTSFVKLYNNARLSELKRFEAGKELMWEVKKASDIGLDYLLEMGTNSANVVTQEKNILIIALFVIMIFGIILTFILANSISKPIMEGITLAEKVAAGDLNITFASNRKDEVGRLSAALDSMVANIKTVIDEIRVGADKMVKASEKLTRESLELSEGATEQASSAEEVSSSMEEMHANIQQNTDNAKQTEKIAKDAAVGIQISNESSLKANEYLTNITDKISIIGDIAFQTNILALNAAVEAARAGQEGRGFAVVAAEVRKLAERSQGAANEINEVSQKTITSSSEAREKLVHITPEIEKTANLVQEITSASLEQVTGIEQINNAIQQLNQITQRNAANSEEISTAAKELEALSGMLKGSISVFKLGDETETIKETDTSRTSTTKQDTPVYQPKKKNLTKVEPIIDLGLNESEGYESF